MSGDQQLKKDLISGITYLLRYLGDVRIKESLKTLTDSAERENLTRHCMYMVCNHLHLCGSNPRVDERLESKVGCLNIQNKSVELNLSYKSFTITGEKIMEYHPIDVISFASPGREDPLKGVFCFVSNVSAEKGRRCLVFLEESGDKMVMDNIMRTMSDIFHYKNQGCVNQRANDVPPHPPDLGHDYVNIKPLDVARGLESKHWFHGQVNRSSAEALLRKEGDFLVRLNEERKFVLSGIANDTCKHFLLLDENDQKVRKEGQVFETIVQLIEHHLREDIPIFSEGSELRLRNPISR